jgi:sugar lactone lactonase YvrE
MTPAARSVCTVGATLGEGPVWVDGALWFTDIKQRKVHRFDPAAADLRSWDAPAQVGWVLPAAQGGFIAGLQTGLHRFDPASGSFDLIVAPEADTPGNRLNDACTDPSGRLWFGSMDDGEAAPSGVIYRADGHGLAAVAGDISITNGPAVSPDGLTLYHNDTLGRIVYTSRIAADGSLADTRVFARIDEADGYPDGPVVDAEGHVWISLWAGWSVRRYAPTGEVVATVRFPVANITKLAFGGPGLTTAYATTAAKGLSDAERAEQPLAGDLFAFDAGVAGQAVTPVQPFGTGLSGGI